MENVKIKLGDGTEFYATLNGNNYITSEAITEEMLEDVNLIGLEIDGVTMENTTCCNFWIAEDGTHIIFRQYSNEELERQALNAKLEYIAMMEDIEL